MASVCYLWGCKAAAHGGECTPQSDIDAVVILDTLTPADLQAYKNILNQLPHQDKACGFISGAEELKNWPRQELFQFKNDTQDIYGHLEPLLPELTRQDALCAMQTGAGTIYHVLCHSYLHGNIQETLPALCKTAFFVLQAQYYLKTGLYVASKAKLLPLLTTKEQSILQVSLNGGGNKQPARNLHPFAGVDQPPVKRRGYALKRGGAYTTNRSFGSCCCLARNLYYM